LIAFVLSGGGNRGPLEAGAMAALLERGITPDFLVGTSAGAINACFVAAHGYSASTLDALRERWRSVNKRTVYPGGLLSIALRVLRGRNSLFAGDGLRQLIEQSLPEGVKTFGDLQVPLFVTAADLRASKLYVFGEDPSVALADAVAASASVPVIHPPVDYFGLQLADGGILANVAASYAMDRGATEIYVINVGRGEERKPAAQGVVDVAMNAITAMTVQSLLRDLARARQDESVDLHHIQIRDYAEISFSDFSKSDLLFAAGRQAALSYLDSPKPEWEEPGYVQDAQPLGAEAPGVRELAIPYP